MFHKHKNPGTKIARKVNPTRRPVSADVEISGFCIRLTTSGFAALVDELLLSEAVAAVALELVAEVSVPLDA